MNSESNNKSYKNRSLILVFISAFLCFFHPNSFVQNHKKFENLVMEGGGIKGIAYGGALVELEKNGILKNIQRVAGTSAGAIQACLLAIGYTPEEIIEIVNNTPIETFNDDGFVSKGSKRLFKEFGWFRGNSFLQTLEQLIYKRTGNSELTFNELHELAKTYPFRDLYVTGTNLSEQKLQVFSYEDFPNMKIADAVRISMSIPLYYRGIWVDQEGNTYESQPDGVPCNLFVDGGLLLNFPIEIFDKEKYIAKDNPDKTFNTATIGLRLEKCTQIDHEIYKKSGFSRFEINDFNTYLDALGALIMRNINPPNPRDIERTIFINDNGLSARVRKVPPSEKTLMMNAGQQAVIEFFGR